MISAKNTYCAGHPCGKTDTCSGLSRSSDESIYITQVKFSHGRASGMSRASSIQGIDMHHLRPSFCRSYSTMVWFLNRSAASSASRAAMRWSLSSIVLRMAVRS